MKDVSAAFRSHLRKGHASLARLWTVTLTNGLRFYLTDHDQDIFYSGDLYRSDPGITVSAIRDTIEGGFQDASVTMSVTQAAITEEMVRYNVIGGATFNLERVFYDHLEYGTIFDFGGSIREAEITDRNALELSVDGMGSLAGGIQLGETYTERCRNVFGDFRCKFDITSIMVPFVVTLTDDSKTRFYMSIALPEQAPPNEELGDVNEQTIFGNGTFVVPDCTHLSVVVAAGGGGQGDLYSAPPEQIPQPGGTDGGNSSFLGVLATGGKGGGLFHDGANGAGSGGDGAGLHAGSGAKGRDASGRAFGGFGGDGGRAVKSWEVGPGKALQVGQQIPYSVGLGGTSGVLAGAGGFITVYWRKAIVSVDDEKLSFGSVRWTSGNNAGFTHGITSIENGLVTLDLNMNYPIEAGDTGIFIPGCNHYRSDCMKYDNIRHYRGEPDVPNVAAKPPMVDPTAPAANTTSSLALPFAPPGSGGGGGAMWPVG